MLRRLTWDDLPAAHGLSRALGWSQRLADWAFHFPLGRGWAIEEDRLLGTAMWWPYGAGYGTVGLVIVAEDQRGKGLGRRLMEAVIDDAGDRALRLTATEAGLHLYRSLGFEECGVIEQRQGFPRPRSRAATHLPADTRLRPVTADDRPVLGALDAAAFGADRDGLIGSLLREGSGVVAERSGRAIAFALRRASGRGTVIGPVVAPDQPLAQALIDALIPGSTEFTRLDIPAEARELGVWLDSAGMVRVDGVTTMVRGQWPAPGAPPRQFALASHALN